MEQPMLWSCMRAYTRKQFAADLVAGVVVGIVALPLAMAFAIASGVSPEVGLYTAIVAGFLISALGGSQVQIGGPTGAFVVLVFDIVQRHGMDGLAVCTLMAGVMLLIMGVARLGALIKYIPYPVIVGFTSGIAVIILSSQVKDLLGLTTGPMPGDVLGKWEECIRTIATTNRTALALSLACIVLIALLRRHWPRLPGALLAMLAATAIVQLCGLQVETIGSRFGGIPSSLPAPRLPSVGFAQVQELIGPAFAVAALAAIESLLSAVVADGMIGARHRPNVELMAQGLANLCSPLFGGIPATGAIARTATNVKNGGRTPVAGMIHAGTLLVIMMVFGRWAGLIPLCSLAAILVVVAYHMSEWRTFRALLRMPRSDVIVLLATFGLTVGVDLVVAVEAGMALAAFLFIRRMAQVTQIDALKPEAAAVDASIPPGVQICEVNGPCFFGAADKLRDALAQADPSPKVLILRLRQVPMMDATGLHALEELDRACHTKGTTMILADVPRRLRKKLRRTEWWRHCDQRNLVSGDKEAVARAQAILGLRADPPQDAVHTHLGSPASSRTKQRPVV